MIDDEVMKSLVEAGSLAEDPKTIRLLYLKETKEFYAWCESKKDLKRFYAERGKDNFIQRKIDLSEMGLQIFYNHMHDLRLRESPLYDGKEWIYILATEKEEDLLSETQDQIESSMYDIRDFYEHNQLIFSDEVIDFMKNATKVVSQTVDDNGYKVDHILEINTFRLFYHLMKQTFSI